MLTKKEKEQIVEEYKIGKGDSGSADVQVALLSRDIENMLSHLKKQPKDNHSRRGLLKMIIKRKKLLKYLEKNDKKRHQSLVKKVGLKSKA